MVNYPKQTVQVNHVEPVPRRLRATLAGVVVADTTDALYVWETVKYPHYYIPRSDIDPAALVDEGHVQTLKRGQARQYGLRSGDAVRPGAVRIFEPDTGGGLANFARIDWAGMDAWFEEDEEVFVHPRDPYVRVDALRSSRTVRVELDGVVLAESNSPVLVFETGLPTRYYLDPTDLCLEHLMPSDTVTACPYKGETSLYYSARVNGRTILDVAWSYRFPTRQLQPIAGLVAFYNEKVQLLVDAVPS